LRRESPPTYSTRGGPDELLGELAALVVGCCTGGDFMKYELGPSSEPARPRSRAILAQRTASMTMPAEFGESHDLELELDVQRHVAEGAALHADVGPLAVVEPRHVVARADVHVAGAHVVVELARDRVGLGDLLGLEALALEHVEEVGVAAHVELARALELDAALAQQARQHAVHDGGADLALMSSPMIGTPASTKRFCQ
jgi:hypothetical protein